MRHRLTVVLSLWEGWRPLYRPEHATALARMLREYLKIPHRIVLLTDMAQEVDEIDEVLPPLEEPEGLRYVHKANCFRRLRLFDPEFNRQFNSEWLMCIDLDTVILNDITELVEHAITRKEGVCLLWSKFAHIEGARPFNGGMYFLKTGENGHVWSEFNGAESQAEIAKTKWTGSDQVWMCLQLPNAPAIGRNEGVYYHEEYRDRLEPCPTPLIINYAGPTKPWSKTGKRETPDLWKQWHRFAEC